MAGESPRDRGEQQKSADEGPRPSRRSHSLEPSFVSRTKATELQSPRKRAQVSKGPERLSRASLVPGPGVYGGRGAEAGPRTGRGPSGATLYAACCPGLEPPPAPR